MTVKKSRGKKIIAIILCILALLSLTALWFFSPTDTPAGRSYAAGAEEGVWNNVSSADWMAHIGDATKLSAVSLPGSHDSCTQFVCLPLVGRCQDTSVSQQLNSGIRALDIRLRTHDDGSVTLSHGFLNCKTEPHILSDDVSFSQILSECYAFLDANPTETILMMVKHEYGDGTAAKLDAGLKAIIDDNSDYWYTENRDPAMSEVRGKIVLARRYGAKGDESLMGLDFWWEDQSGSAPLADPVARTGLGSTIGLCVQDRYEFDTEDKLDAVMYALLGCPDGNCEYTLNYLSTKGSASVGIPMHYAQVINSWFMEKELRSDTDYGCIMFDFADEILARHVFASNTYVQ